MNEELIEVQEEPRESGIEVVNELIGADIQIDPTLTTEGAAADAKATGDAIAAKYTKPAAGIPAGDLAGLNAGNIAYDDTETYQSGTAGAALNDLNRQLSDETTGLDTKAPVIINTASGAIASFSDGADSMPIRKIVGTIVPVQAGSGDPSPDNIRPISGWTGANIEQRRKNLWDYIPGDGMSSTVMFTDLGSGGLKAEVINPSVERFPAINNLRLKDFNLQIGEIYTIWQGVTSTAKIKLFMTNGAGGGWHDVDQAWTFTYAKSMENYTLAAIKVTNATLEVGDTQVFYPQLVKGSSIMTPWQPFVKRTIPVNWESEAGTVYGGTVTLNEDGSADVVATLGRVDARNMTFTRFSSPYEDRDNNIYGPVLNIDAVFKNTGSTNSPAYSNVAKVGSGATGKNFVISAAVFLSIYSPTPLTTGAEVLEYLSSIGFYVVGMLVTPQTYHFSNIGSLLTYYGQNNVWIDTGAITECDYPADTKLFLTARDEEITGNIAPIENGTTASQAYAQGAYFWHDTKFCKALTAIASGATFTLNTNYTITTVAAELLAAQN